MSLSSGSSGNCYLLKAGDDVLLIDAGIGIRNIKKRLAMAGVSMRDVHDVLVTHDHADHIKSLGVLCRDTDAQVYATPTVHEGISRNYSVHPRIGAGRCVSISKGETFGVRGFSVTAFDVPHDSSDCVGYCIRRDGISFVLITDAGTMTDEMRRYVGEANYLVIEANHDEDLLRNGHYPQMLKDRIAGPHGHTSNRTCAETIRDHASGQLRHVWLCHLSGDNNTPQVARETVAAELGKMSKPPKLDVLMRGVPSEVFQLGDS